MITIDQVAASKWRTIMDYAGARFAESEVFPGVYRRMRRRDDGSVEVRYACDADGVVTPALGDVAATLNAERETISFSEPRFTAGDDNAARDD